MPNHEKMYNATSQAHVYVLVQTSSYPVGLLHKVGASKPLERSTAKNTNLPLHSAAMFWYDAQGSSAKFPNDASMLMLPPCTKLRFDEFSSNGFPEN